MTTGGWITMIVGLAAVWSGAIWCYAKVLRTPADEKAPPSFGP